MEFGSAYIYGYARSSEEELSEGELEEGMWLSDSDDDIRLPPPPLPTAAPKQGLLSRIFTRKKTGKPKRSEEE